MLVHVVHAHQELLLLVKLGRAVVGMQHTYQPPPTVVAPTVVVCRVVVYFTHRGNLSAPCASRDHHIWCVVQAACISCASIRVLLRELGSACYGRPRGSGEPAHSSRYGHLVRVSGENRRAIGERGEPRRYIHMHEPSENPKRRPPNVT